MCLRKQSCSPAKRHTCFPRSRILVEPPTAIKMGLTAILVKVRTRCALHPERANIDEIHTRVFENTAIASGFLSAQGKRPDGTTFRARVRFLAALVKHDGVWQLVATQSTPIKATQPARK